MSWIKRLNQKLINLLKKGIGKALHIVHRFVLLLWQTSLLWCIHVTHTQQPEKLAGKLWLLIAWLGWLIFFHTFLIVPIAINRKNVPHASQIKANR